jgi:hypothetical protein
MPRVSRDDRKMGRACRAGAMTLPVLLAIVGACQSQVQPAQPRAPYYAPIVTQGPPGAQTAPPPPSYPPPQYPPPQYPPPQYEPPPPPPPPRKTEHHALCFAGRPFECASVLLVELGYRANSHHSVVTGDFGLLIHSGYDAFGVTIGLVGVSDDARGGFGVYAGRYRRYLGKWGVATDLSVGYGGGGLIGEVAFGWADVLAITAGAQSIELEDGRRDVIFTTGFRLGSVALGGILYVAALVGTAGR